MASNYVKFFIHITSRSRSTVKFTYKLAVTKSVYFHTYLVKVLTFKTNKTPESGFSENDYFCSVLLRRQTTIVYN